MVDEDEGVSGSTEVSIGELIERRLSRRGALFGLVGTAAAAALGGGKALAQKGTPSSFTFKEVPHVNDPTHHVPDDYEVQILIRWGDPVVPGAPKFDDPAPRCSGLPLVMPLGIEPTLQTKSPPAVSQSRRPGCPRLRRLRAGCHNERACFQR